MQVMCQHTCLNEACGSIFQHEMSGRCWWAEQVLCGECYINVYLESTFTMPEAS